MNNHIRRNQNFAHCIFRLVESFWNKVVIWYGLPDVFFNALMVLTIPAFKKRLCMVSSCSVVMIKRFAMLFLQYRRLNTLPFAHFNDLYKLRNLHPASRSTGISSGSDTARIETCSFLCEDIPYLRQ